MYIVNCLLIHVFQFLIDPIKIFWNPLYNILRMKKFTNLITLISASSGTVKAQWPNNENYIDTVAAFERYTVLHTMRM